MVTDFPSSVAMVWATTDVEEQAAAIALRLIEDEGKEAVIFDAPDVTIDGFPISTNYKYVVLILAKDDPETYIGILDSK